VSELGDLERELKRARRDPLTSPALATASTDLIEPCPTSDPLPALLMGPLDTKIAQEIDAYILNQAVAGAGLGTLMKDVLGHYRPMKPKTLWLRHVVDVRPTNNARLFKPPGLRITTNIEETYDLGIVLTPTTMSRNPKNNVVRNAAVQLIRSAVQAAGGTPRAGPRAKNPVLDVSPRADRRSAKWRGRSLREAVPFRRSLPAMSEGICRS
jgi:hypothetical protein